MKITKAIICVYNEEKTVAAVVSKVVGPSFDQVIIVNDGSTDSSHAMKEFVKEGHQIAVTTF